MSFQDAIKTCFKKYATFNGVASRPEYWKFTLFYWLGIFVLSSLKSTLLGGLWYLGFFLPLLAAAVRRMHDSGRTGWLILIPIVNIVLLAMPTDPTSKYSGFSHGSNSYCSTCGSPLQGNGGFCPSCGAKL
jgi:uncharacterized membrane protein YhaH (DUF805 family)